MADKSVSKYKISYNKLLGNHLSSIEVISPGETLFIESPIFVGPRNTFPDGVSICLSCCEKTENICSSCKWSICSKQCEENHWHLNYECKIFKKRKIPAFIGPYFWVSILRCLLLQNISPDIWEKIKKFESHREERNKFPFQMEQRHQAIEVIRNGFKCSEFSFEDIDFVYGVLVVNGYGDSSRYSLKLYELASKISHSCMPNTRSLLLPPCPSGTSNSQKLKIYSILPIDTNQVLTQLYSNLVTGTYKRQQIIQETYFFTCQCFRCTDPTELLTHFSTVRCQNADTCNNELGLILPEHPTNLLSLWKCQNCQNVWNYDYICTNILDKIELETGIGIYDAFYSNFEVYSNESPEKVLEGNEAISMQIEYLKDLVEKVEMLSKHYVHRNHYGLLPHKTSIISTIHEILAKAWKSLERDVTKKLLEMQNKLCQEVLNIFNVLLPGLTRDRGMLLFYSGVNLYLHELLDDVAHSKRRSMELLTESEEIFNLEPDSDIFKQSIIKFKTDYSPQCKMENGDN